MSVLIKHMNNDRCQYHNDLDLPTRVISVTSKNVFGNVMTQFWGYGRVVDRSEVNVSWVIGSPSAQADHNNAAIAGLNGHSRLKVAIIGFLHKNNS